MSATDEAIAPAPACTAEPATTEPGPRVPALPAAALTALGGCGGSGDDVDPLAAPQAARRQPGANALSEAQCARFLGHATMGVTPDLIADVQWLGYDGWLDYQFGFGPERSRWKWLNDNGYTARRDKFGYNQVIWRGLISGNTFRQRMTLALSEILVVSVQELPKMRFKANVGAAYFDLLERHAFGTYRQLLEEVSKSPAMGNFLTYNGNRKSDGVSHPDENYARELLQLFTIGLYKLNMDGTPELDRNGMAIETYGAKDITELAKVFTGWYLDPGPDNMPPEQAQLQMVQSAHDPGPKTFLGTTISSGNRDMRPDESLRKALDVICAHPNVAPFVSRQLIQRLVTSNPSPAYVKRVALVYRANNGTLRDVYRAILTDPEATGDKTLTDPHFGKFREPILRFTAWARAFKAEPCACSERLKWKIGDTSGPTELAQCAGRSPSVFNFFRPGYVPAHMARPQVAPEFQIVSEASIVGYVNFMQTAVSGDLAALRPDYSGVLPLASNARDIPKLLDRLNLLLAAGQVSKATLNKMADALRHAEAGRKRLHAALTMVLAAPEFIVQR